jgi:hypothetical protein
LPRSGKAFARNDAVLSVIASAEGAWRSIAAKKMDCRAPASPVLAMTVVVPAPFPEKHRL